MTIALSMPGYAKVKIGAARGLVSEPCVRAVESILSTETLYRYASRQPDARSFKGRAPAYAVMLGECGSVVVRHAMRGGLLGKTGSDLFLPPTRGLRELVNSLRLRLSGVPTPEVLAVISYHAGPLLRRGDVATREIPDSHDLSVVLREMRDRTDREACLRATGRLLSAMSRAGAHHPDLNARNVLMTWDSSEGAKAHILDIDRIRFHVPGDPMVGRANLERLERSLKKLTISDGLEFTQPDMDMITSSAAEGKSDA